MMLADIVSSSRSDVLLEVDTEKLVWYDLDKNKVRKVRMRDIPVECNSFVYTENLLKLTMDKPLHHKSTKQKSSKDKQDKNQTKRRSEVCTLHMLFQLRYLRSYGTDQHLFRCLTSSE
ncbi:hypothetical protein AgCh_021857 [Apium graveolens]